MSLNDKEQAVVLALARYCWYMKVRDTAEMLEDGLAGDPLIDVPLLRLQLVEKLPTLTADEQQRLRAEFESRGKPWPLDEPLGEAA